ncbi:MAG: molybdopterin molybdotransferase MoeA [Deltaproteobacteria bacterium]|nr:molybdopterin molybdotransferase MoeA [Deltaproteobacteria bacterium]
MIPVKQALDIILNEIKPLGAESAGILDSLGRVLAEDITALRPNPPWDNSAMDGFAVRSADTVGAAAERPVSLKVIYDLAAGSVPKGPVKDKTCVRIMTGAPMPDGADAVVMMEYTSAGADTAVLIHREAKTGEHIRKAGEDFKARDVVLKAGITIRPAEAAMLATVGRANALVRKRPVAAVISTGDELVEIDKTLSPGKILNSNGYALCALVMSSGAKAMHLGIARDTRKSLTEKLKAAMEADCIITSGGVSVGDYDLVKDVLRELGSEMRFWKVALKPGKPLAFGIIQGKPAFGLPGNPISSMVAFEQFVRPALLKMAGYKEIFRSGIKAVVTADVKIKPGRMNFLRARTSFDGKVFSVEPLQGQGSGMISSMAAANSFIVIPEDSSGCKKGEEAVVQLFDESILGSAIPCY